MDSTLGHHLVSLVFAGAAIVLALLIVIKKLHARLEFRFCVVLLALYCLWQISELFGGLMEHFFSDIFKLAPMLLLVLFGLQQRITDQQQTEAIDRLRAEVDTLQRELALKKMARTP